MALVLADRVQETSTSTGSSLFALGGAVDGFQTFNVGIGNSNTTYYTITDGINWMDVIGTYTTANNSLTVDTVLSSSAGGTTAFNFSTGIKNVFCTYPASKSVYKDASNQVTLASQLNLTNASNYNLYASGAGANYLAGKTGFGSTSLGGVFGHVSNQLTLSGATDCAAYGAINTINSDVTNTATIYKSQPATQAASFTLPTLIHFSAQQYTIGLNSVVTNQYGFLADSSLTNAANNNHGFRGNIASGSNRYNLYMAGTADNYLAGNLGIGTSLASSKLHVRSDGDALTIFGQFQNRVSGANTGSVLAFITSANNIDDNRYSYIGSVTTGVGQNGNNLVFASNANGQAAVERMRIDSFGNVGIGSSPFSSTNLLISKNITGATSMTPVLASGTIQSDVVTSVQMYATFPSTAAAAFTLNALTHFNAAQGTIGATSSIITQYGFSAGATLTGATSNNYGFIGNIASGTGRYNLYMNGTAPNYLAGDLQLAKTVTAAGTTGAQTINKTTGTVNFAAGAASLVVTNSLVTANSIIIATVGSNDTTMKSVQVVAAAGSFTIYANAAATAETRVNFLITN
jgi:hypothetical protein